VRSLGLGKNAGTEGNHDKPFREVWPPWEPRSTSLVVSFWFARCCLDADLGTQECLERLSKPW